MKRKVKLISSIFSLALAFAFMSYGVYAAAARQAAVTGSLSFSSTSVNATIVVSSATGAGAYTQNGATITFAPGSQGGTAAEDRSFGTIAFNDTTTTFKYKVVITVTASTRPVNVVYAESVTTMPAGVARTAQKGVGASPTMSNLSSQTADTNNNLAVGGILTYEFTYTLSSPQSAANFGATSIINSTFTLSRVTA